MFLAAGGHLVRACPERVPLRIKLRVRRREDTHRVRLRSKQTHNRVRQLSVRRRT